MGASFFNTKGFMKNAKEVDFLQAMLCVAAEEVLNNKPVEDLPLDKKDGMEKLIESWTKKAGEKFKLLKPKTSEESERAEKQLQSIYDDMHLGDRVQLHNGIEIIAVPGGWIHIVDGFQPVFVPMEYT
jgi:hypothetical protein